MTQNWKILIIYINVGACHYGAAGAAIVRYRHYVLMDHHLGSICRKARSNWCRL